MKTYYETAMEEIHKAKSREENATRVRQEASHQEILLQNLIRATLNSLLDNFAQLTISRNRVYMWRSDLRFEFAVEWNRTKEKWRIVWKPWWPDKDEVFSLPYGKAYSEEEFNDKFGKWLGRRLYQETVCLE